jgi:protein SCO1/2
MLKIVRVLAWALVAVAIAGIVALVILSDRKLDNPKATAANLGGPFTLVDGDGKPFSSYRLAGKPYAIYFGFTRCGDVCPTTLQRLVKLRREAGAEDAMHIVFVTIDPKNDGPKEVGQYAELFNAPIIGLTGSPEQIAQVKKQYGIFAEPAPHPMPGKEIAHTATVLLFDRHGQFTGTIAANESDSSAVTTIKQLIAV